MLLNQSFFFCELLNQKIANPDQKHNPQQGEKVQVIQGISMIYYSNRKNVCHYNLTDQH